MPRSVSLSAIFKRQQELPGGSMVLPLKGRVILAVTLATALLPLLETEWVKPSFNHSKIQFFQPREDGQLPNITKPFLTMEDIPIFAASKNVYGTKQANLADSMHMIHPDASVLALGILLCELHYCTPIELLRKDTDTARNVNTDFYTALHILRDLEDDVGVDYYLATKACLMWEYYPTGELAGFKSASVQRSFYQNVVKRLEAVVFKAYGLRLEDLDGLGSRENELCWGLIGREVIRQQTSKSEHSAEAKGERSNFSPLASSFTPSSYGSHSSSIVFQMPAQRSQSIQNRPQPLKPYTKSLDFFDASHQTVDLPE